MAFTGSRTYDADFHQVLNTAEDVLAGMGFDLRYRNASTGRLLFHGASTATGATGWLDISVEETRKGVRVRAITDSYDIWSNRRLLDVLDWLFHHMDVRMGTVKYSHPPATGIGATAPYEPVPSEDGVRPTLVIDPPGRTTVALLSLLPAVALLGLASFQVEVAGDLLMVLAAAAPFMAASAMAAAGLLRAAGAICVVFSIFAGLLFGAVGWFLVFATGEYAGHVAMVEGRWWTFRRQVLREAEGPRSGE